MHLRNKRWEEGEDENERQRSGHDDFVQFFPAGEKKIVIPVNLYSKGRNKLWQQGEDEREA